MLKKTLIYFAPILILFFFTKCVNKAQSDEDKIYLPENISASSIKIYNQIDSLINVKAKRAGFNGNILVKIKDELIYQKSIGYSQFRPKENLAPNSIFQLASLSKQFTAMAIMILREEGKLSYKDDIKKYIPDLPYDDITIRMLLNHTSGMPNYMYLTENFWKSDSIPYNSDVIRLINKHKPNLYFNPDTKFNYSNTGYVVLAHIVEVITGKLFADYLKEKIFEPLEMNDSFVYSRAIEREYKKRVNGYFRWRGRYSINLETVNDGIVGDKNVYSTAEDLIKWNNALDKSELVSKEILDEAYTRLTLKNGNNWHYGFGFRLKDYDEEKIIYHYGRWNSFKNCFMKLPKYESAIIVLNNTNRNIKWLVDDITEIIKQAE